MTEHPQRCEGMTSEHPREYIITEAQITAIENHGWIDAFSILEQVRNQHASRSSASGPVPDSATLIEYAQREWANREERRGIHEKVSWETGWMSGYLTSAGNIQQARQQEREKALDAIQEWVRGNSETIEADDGTLEDAVFLGELLAKLESLRGERE